MKLKKAMRLYDIKKGEFGYSLGKKKISAGISGGWYDNGVNFHTYTEKEAVAWLVEGATKLSPIQIAMRKNKAIRMDEELLVYRLNGRKIWENRLSIPPTWNGEEEFERSSFATEKEAVRWLLTDPEVVKGIDWVKINNNLIGAAATLACRQKAINDIAKLYSKKPFSTVSLLEKSAFTRDSMFQEKEWHKCPTCGKYHRL